MPVATIDPTHFERETLESAPPDGFVMVRPLPYGLKLQRRQKATRMFMEANPNRGKQAEDEAQRFELETLNEWATLFDFKYCIGEHNLTDVNGNALDLGSPLTLRSLNPRIGDELEAICRRYNGDEDTTEEDFTMPPPSSLQSEEITSPDLETVEV